MSMSPSFWNGKRVLLTGHTGFKGAWLGLWLARLGATVRGFSLAPASEPSLHDLARAGEFYESREGDVRDYEAVLEQFVEHKPEVVFHLAAQALVRPSFKNPVDTYSTNVMGVVHVLEAARQSGSACAILNVTSDKCYENREHVWGYRENEPMGGYDPYSSSKGCAELVTSAYRRSFFTSAGVGLASARAGNVIGGGDWAEDRLVPDCMRALAAGQAVPIRNPGAIRPWQHVLEPLGAYLLLAERLYERPADHAQGWNFGPSTDDARPVSWIADRLVELWGGGARWTDERKPGAVHEARTLKLDCALAEAKLGWKPTMRLEQALERTVEWHRRLQEGESARELCFEQISRYQDIVCSKKT